MKKFTIIALILLAISVLIFITFGLRQTNPSSISVSTFLPVFEQQIEALNKKNPVSYLNTIHKDSPSYAATQQLLKDQFEKYDQTFELMSWEVVGATNNEINVKVIYAVKNIKGSEIRDTKVTSTNTLKKSGDSWKLWNTVINKTEYLDNLPK